jgi:hypothetical protein
MAVQLYALQQPLSFSKKPFNVAIYKVRTDPDKNALEMMTIIVLESIFVVQKTSNFKIK